MKYLLIILSTFLFACGDNSTGKQDNNESESKAHEHEIPEDPLPGKKWNADSATKSNLANLVSILDSTESAKNEDKLVLANSVQAGLDKLVKDCKMQGEDHDALHVWLEDVLNEVKDLKEDDDPYKEAYADLRKSVESFYDKFQ